MLENVVREACEPLLPYLWEVFEGAMWEGWFLKTCLSHATKARDCTSACAVRFVCPTARGTGQALPRLTLA